MPAEKKHKKADLSLKTILTRKMVLAFMIPITISIIVVIAITFVNLSAEKNREIQTRNSLLMANMTERIQKFQSEVQLLAQNGAVASLDPGQAEPYLQSFMQTEGEVWSHFLITDGTGTNLAHTDGESARGVSIADRSYFTVPWNEGKTFIAEPTISKSTGRRILAIGTPIYKDGAPAGVLVGFVRLEYISQALNEFDLTKSSFSFMLNPNGLVSAHPNEEIVLVQNWLEPAAEDEEATAYVDAMSKGFAEIVNKMVAGDAGIQIAGVDGRLSLVCYEPLGLAGLSVATVAPVMEVYSVLIVLVVSLVLAALVTILLNVLTSAKVASSITKPLVGLTNWARNLAAGDHSGEKSQFVDLGHTQGEEILLLVDSFEEMQKNVRENVELLQEVADGNLAVSAEPRSEKDVLALALNKLTHQVSHTLADISGAVQQVSSSSGHLAASAQSLAQGTVEQAASVESLSAAIGGMQQQFETTGENVNKITADSGLTEAELHKTNEHMRVLMEEIHQANAKSTEISKIIKTIEDIAFQTNILALNAAVEAARAGAAGKGFAVVADEVRSLAAKSAEAAQNTTNLIESTVSSISKVAQTAEVTVGTMDSINTMTQGVAEDARLIAGTIEEELETMRMIVQSIESISGVVQSNSAMSEESAASSEELSSQAQLMQRLVAQFRLREDEPPRLEGPGAGE